jgi:hypothetical protein
MNAEDEVAKAEMISAIAHLNLERSPVTRRS